MPNLLDLIRQNNIFGGEMPPMNPPTTPGFNPNDPWGHLKDNQPRDMFNRSSIGLEGRGENLFRTDPITNRMPPQADTPTMTREQEIIDMINSLYKPENRYAEMYEKEVQNRPVREKRSIGRKILGSAIGFFSGPETATRFTYPTYSAALPAWQDKVKNLEPLMREERAGNQQGRQIASTAASAIMQDRRLAETERANKAREAQNEKKIQLQAIKNQGWKLKTGEDGFIYAINADGTQTRKTDVKSGELSEAEKIGLQLDSTLAAIEARGDIQTAINNADNLAAAERAKLSAETQTAIAELRAEVARGRVSNPVQAFDQDGKPLPYMVAVDGSGNLKTIPLPTGAVTRTRPPGTPASSDPSAMSETQKEQLKINRANEIINKYPQLKQFLTISGTGVNVKSVNTGTSVGRIFGGYGNLDAATRQKMVDYIDGKTNVFELDNAPATPNTRTASRTPAAPTTTKPIVPKGELLLKDKDGKDIGTIRDTPDQIAAAKKAGYTVVGK